MPINTALSDKNDRKPASDFLASGLFGPFFDSIGILLHRKLIDIEMVDEIFSFYIKAAWEKLKPLIEGRRKDLDPKFRKSFEYLYNEMQKGEQRLQAKKG